MLDSALEVIFESDHLIAINKPHGLLVHRSNIARDAKEFALQLVRDYVGEKVYLCHRLDRKTSGVLLFAKNPIVNAEIQEQFANRSIKKKYMAIVRGFVDDDGVIDYAIAEDDKPLQDAITEYTCLHRFEIDLPHGKFDTSRYSLVEVEPQTGRFHQIRKHFSHIFHPIVGDRPHGCNKQNRLWKEVFNMESMLLHAKELSFRNTNGEEIVLEANFSNEFQRVLDILKNRSINS
jgi:tRNA pseudouridine65 synthase